MKTFYTKIKFTFFSFLFLGQLLLSGFVVPTVYAQTPPPATTQTIKCGTGFTPAKGICIPESPVGSSPDSLTGATSVMDLILRVLKILLTVVGVIAVVLIVIGGFQYMTAGGNEEQAEKGRKAIVNAAIGLIVVILSYTIVAVITKTLTDGLGV